MTEQNPNPTPGAPPADPAATPPVGGTPAGTPPQNDPPKMPEGLDATYWDQQSGQVKLPDLVKDFGELKTIKEQHDARLASIPQEYAFDLPQDFQAPDGIEIKFDPQDPRMAQATALAKEAGIDQATFSKLLALDAQRIVDDHKASAEEHAAEMQKLGENGTARVDAINSFLGTLDLNEQEEEAIAAVIYSADSVSAFEKVMAKAMASHMPGGQSPGGQPPQPAIKRPADVLYPSTPPQQKAS